MRTQRGRTRARTVTDQPSLLARIERAIYRLQNTHGLPLRGVLRDCADDHVCMRRVLCELREAVLGISREDQTDRLRARDFRRGENTIGVIPSRGFTSSPQTQTHEAQAEQRERAWLGHATRDGREEVCVGVL